MWDDFRAALERVLLNYEERVMLVISDQERESLLVQFFGLDEGRGQDCVVAQLGFRDTGDVFSSELVSQLEQLGFEEQYEYGERWLWQRDLPWPTPSKAIAETVQACLLRLRDIGGMSGPERLQYRAWCYPEPPGPSGSFEGLDPGEDSVAFPSLGIAQQPRETW